jgi:hypothetical protein
MRRLALLMGLACLGAMLVWLDVHPIRLPAGGPRIEATISARDQGHPVLLVVDFASLKASRPRALEERWADLEWSNILTQGFGGCDIADLADLEDVLDERELVVVGRRTALRLSPLQIRVLADRVDQGLEVLIEAPDSSLCKEFGLELAAVERRQKLPWPRPVVAMGDLLPPLRPEAIAVAWTRLRYAPALLAQQDRPRIQLSLDGRPMGWVRERGEGAWIVLALDFAELCTRLRQGAPSSDLRLREHTDTIEPSTQDLAASRELLTADDAWVDAWVEGICGAALTRTPMPRISTVSWAADGWLLLGEELTEPESPLVRESNARTLPVSVFALAPPPGSVARSAGASLLARWPGPTLFADRARNKTHDIGLGSIHPFARPPSIFEQTEALTRSTGAAPRTNRNLLALWSATPDRCFEEILGAGIEIDTSFGPAPAGAGWLFGSGVPFAPVATNGLAFALTEIPLHARITDQPLDVRLIERWMRRNARGGASPIQLAFDSRRGGLKPAEAAELATLADRNRYAVTTPEELVEWWKLRSQVVLRTKPTDEGVEITIGEIPDAGIAVLVPVRWRNRSLAGWDADWGLARSRKTQRFDRGYRLLELGAGASGGHLRLRYH